MISSAAILRRLVLGKAQILPRLSNFAALFKMGDACAGKVEPANAFKGVFVIGVRLFDFTRESRNREVHNFTPSNGDNELSQNYRANPPSRDHWDSLQL